MASGGSNSSLSVLQDYKDRSRLFSVVHGGKMRESRHNFKPERFRLVTNKTPFPMRNAKQ